MSNARRIALCLACVALALGGLASLLKRSSPSGGALEGAAGPAAPEHVEPIAEAVASPVEPRSQRSAAAPAVAGSSDGALEPSAAAAPVERAPISGLVVDQRMNPLGHCRVRVSMLPQSKALEPGVVNARENQIKTIEEVETDADGRFRTLGAHPPGPYWISADFADCERNEVEGEWLELPRRPPLFHHLEPRPLTSLTLQVVKGPRYEIDVALPLGYAPCDFRGAIHGSTGPCAPGQSARLAGGGRPYRLRFDAAPEACRAPWSLELASDDGWWAGSAPIDAIDGPCAAPISIELGARARIAGSVRDAQGYGILRAELAFESAAGGEARATARADGSFVLDALPAGPGTLRASARLHAAAERELVLVALHEERVELVLAEIPHGDVRGFLRARSGSLAPVPRIHLRAVDDKDGPGERGLVFGIDASTARFEFLDVPAGDYELVLEPLDGRRWSATRLAIRAPASGIELVRLDDELPMLVLDVLDARDGTRVAKPYCFVDDEGGARCVEGGFGTLLVDRLTPATGPIVTVCAEGFRPAELAIRSLPQNGRFRSGSVSLHAGWGVLARVLDESGEPLAGATILCDGRASSVTRADGRALLSADAAPQWLELALDGYALREELGDLRGRELVLRAQRAE